MSRSDPLGDRMKVAYERSTHVHLPRRTYWVIRVDGRAFHTYTRDLAKPFDEGLRDDLTSVAVALCEEIQGAYLAYAQSDEVSVLTYDNYRDRSESWFDGDLQKIVSVAASIATVAFARARVLRCLPLPVALVDAVPELERATLAMFDARAFTIGHPVEVANYLVWRQRDAVRNSISMAARAHLAHHECEGLTSNQLQEKLFRERGVNWNDYDARFKRGTLVYPVTRPRDVEFVDSSGATRVARDVIRREWVAEAPETFRIDSPELVALIPRLSESGDQGVESKSTTK